MKKRLPKNDWLDHGLRVLAETGAGGLKAEPLATALGVSRGNFYWHFQFRCSFGAVSVVSQFR